MQSGEYSLQRKHMTQFLRKRVEHYVDLFKYGAQQGTEDWIKSKRRTIGGSEMATLMGVNKYSSVQQLVAQKVGLQQFGGSVKTRWGNLFEPVIQIVVEWDMDTRIIGDQISIPGVVPNQSYSPDGIGVVETEVKLSWLEIYRDDKGKDAIGREGTVAYYQEEKIVLEPSIVLFEFKCPFNRLPNGKIPDYYEPQVKTGLDTIRDNFGALKQTPVEADPELEIDSVKVSKFPATNDKTMCDYGLYIEAQFRKCSWPNLGPNSIYDRELWPGDLVTKRIPISYGFIGFYISPGFGSLFKYFDSVVTEVCGTHARPTEAAIGAIIEGIFAELADNNKFIEGIRRYELAEILPGKEITLGGIKRILGNYYALSKMMRENCIDVLGIKRIDELVALPDGDISKSCEFGDFGELNLASLEILFEAFQAGVICPWYSNPSYTSSPQYRSRESSLYPKLTPKEETRNKNNSSAAEFLEYCSLRKYDIAGVFPWKLFKLDYHRIEKEVGYVGKWKDKIAETIQIVDKLNNAGDDRKKLMEYVQIYGSTL